MDYCDAFIRCLYIRSDGNHSLQKLYWWASDVMLIFSKSVPLKKQTLPWIAWKGVHFHFWVNHSFKNCSLTGYLGNPTEEPSMPLLWKPPFGTFSLKSRGGQLSQSVHVISVFPQWSTSLCALRVWVSSRGLQLTGQLWSEWMRRHFYYLIKGQT